MLDVLIIGAGPTGLVLALWLAKKGVRIRIIDKTSEPGTTSRALGVQARSMEYYDQMGIADDVLRRSRKIPAANLWVAGKKRGRLDIADMGKGMSPYPWPLIYPQDEHEKMLIGHLAKLGVEVERNTELLDFEEKNDRIVARLTRDSCEAKYIAGCDGAHSTVREKLEIGFEGGTYEHLFYVADAEASGDAMNGEIHVGLDAADFLALFPLKDEGRVRLIGTVRDIEQKDLSWDDVQTTVIKWLGIDVKKVNWFSTYKVHHRVAAHFRKGRAFLLGDAAHIHSPVGGQGMNTGIGDAVNLAWKLAANDAKLLDTYEPERIAFARRLVKTTDQAFVAVVSSTWRARFIRLRIAPRVLPVLIAFRRVRRFMFRTISQINIRYGDMIRLPWTGSNYEPLKSMDWQVHVYGKASPEIEADCKQRGLPLHVFPAHEAFERDVPYFIRPDGYVASIGSIR
jgi:2-polyprenyl-6-methoxyphenol hydroxylase-like FAD-dependent oxidoreductase